MEPISAQERKQLAVQVGVDEQYLYQCLTGRKSMRPDEAVRVDRQSGGRIRRWHLRSRDWWLIWPELVGQSGAPAISASAHQEAA